MRGPAELQGFRHNSADFVGVFAIRECNRHAHSSLTSEALMKSILAVCCVLGSVRRFCLRPRTEGNGRQKSREKEQAEIYHWQGNDVCHWAC